uniref:Uncharacterized protein n=1 Tax=Romanomermis culicivorax TaxID=13658 RepID=A0A915KVJ6_ROMCU
MSVVCRTKIQN